MDYEQLLELVQARRSIRRFKPDPIPDDYIQKIIEAARWAPSGFNMQPWEFVVVTEPELKGRIADMVKDYRRTHFPVLEATRESWQGPPWRPYHRDDQDFSQAPVYILLLGDPRAKAGLPMTVRYNPSKRECIHLSSLANSFLYMHLAATSLGLASQWVTAVQVPLIHGTIKELLNIPVELEIYDMMAVGRPASKPAGKFLRAKDEIIHYNRCSNGEFRDEEKVRDFIRRARSWAAAAVRRGPEDSE